MMNGAKLYERRLKVLGEFGEAMFKDWPNDSPPLRDTIWRAFDQALALAALEMQEKELDLNVYAAHVPKPFSDPIEITPFEGHGWQLRGNGQWKYRSLMDETNVAVRNLFNAICTWIPARGEPSLNAEQYNYVLTAEENRRLYRMFSIGDINIILGRLRDAQLMYAGWWLHELSEHKTAEIRESA